MKNALMFFSLFVLLSCASTPKPEITTTDRSYPISFDKAWAAVIETLEEEMWEIDSMDKKAGSITTKFMTMGVNRDEYACPSTFRRRGWIDELRCKLRVNVEHIADNLTKIRIDGQIQGRKVYMHRSSDDITHEHIEGWVDCTSTGKIEREMLDTIHNRL